MHDSEYPPPEVFTHPMCAVRILAENNERDTACPHKKYSVLFRLSSLYIHPYLDPAILYSG